MAGFGCPRLYVNNAIRCDNMMFNAHANTLPVPPQQVTAQGAVLTAAVSGGGSFANASLGY